MGRIILGGITNMVCLSFACAGQIIPSEILKKYTAKQEAVKCQIIKSEELVEAKDTARGDMVRWMRLVYEFRTDGKRTDLDIKKWLHLDAPDTGELPEDLLDKRKNEIWDGGRWVEHSFAMESGSTDTVFISNNEQRKRLAVATAYGGSPLDGIFTGDFERVEVILGRASDIRTRSQTEAVNGVHCYVIDANTPNGKYTLWFDPQHGYNIAKAKIEKTVGDIAYGNPLGQHPPHESKRLKLGRMEEISFSLDRVEFQKIGDVCVPVEADYQYTIRFDDGRAITDQKYHRRTHIDLNPDFEAVGAFVPHIPDGAAVRLDGVDGIMFEWREGEPVPAVDKYVVSELDRMAEEIISERSEHRTTPPAAALPTPTKSETGTDSNLVELPQGPESGPGATIGKQFPWLWSGVAVLCGCVVLAGACWMVHCTGRKRLGAK